MPAKYARVLYAVSVENDYRQDCVMTLPITNSEQALEALLAGNRRYAAMRQEYPRQSSDHRTQVLEGQNPFAVILSCSDSRVPSELIFDQGLGDLFIVRTAGHVVDDIALASIEFAVYSLNVPLVMVLGHSMCGAVTAAASGKIMPGAIPHLTVRLKPALASVSGTAGDLVMNATQSHSRLTAAYITAASPVIAQAVESGSVRIVSAYYDLATAHVEIV